MSVSTDSGVSVDFGVSVDSGLSGDCPSAMDIDNRTTNTPRIAGTIGGKAIALAIGKMHRLVKDLGGTRVIDTFLRLHLVWAAVIRTFSGTITSFKLAIIVLGH
ncbi:hypothetical protein [Novipirellula rosea]|uniref:hypothetical protein n=1 Tax=Novipirellula rosea TaxID=1031540 RepID=UPI0031EA5E99